MRKFLGVVIVLLISFSVLRLLNGNGEFLSVNVLLGLLADIDIEFENTLETLIAIRDTLKLPDFPVDTNLFEGIGYSFKWLFEVLKGIFTVPIVALRDLLNFFASCLDLLKVLA